MSTSTRTSAPDGFSLVEKLLVLAIVAALSGFGWARVGSSSDRLKLEAAAGDIALQLRRARADAMRTNTDHVIAFDRRNRSYGTTEHKNTRTLEPGIDLSVSGAGIETATNAVDLIRFRPDGSACDARVTLKRGASTAIIVVDWITGATRISWGA